MNAVQPSQKCVEDVVAVVEAQWRELKRLDSLLACAHFALNYGDWIEEEEEIDAEDVLSVVRAHVRRMTETLQALTTRAPVADEHEDEEKPARAVMPPAKLTRPRRRTKAAKRSR